MSTPALQKLRAGVGGAVEIWFSSGIRRSLSVSLIEIYGARELTVRGGARPMPGLGV